MKITANDPSRKSFVQISADSDFPIQNLPFGIFSTLKNPTKRVGVALGDFVIDLVELYNLEYIDELVFTIDDLQAPYLNSMMKHGKLEVRNLRNRIANLFDASNPTLPAHKEHLERILVKKEQAHLHMPVQVGDYTDFYSSREHATNVGAMFRDPDNALLPNWLHLPVGYHGRASSIVLSGTPVKRPLGQQKPKDATKPVFGPSQMLDFELEIAFITFDGKPLGERISTAEAEDYIFGMCLFNDWSARDIQTWEYVPLGPFLAKNFASSISPWIVTLDALEPFRVEGPVQDPEPLPYLHFEGNRNIDLNLNVYIQPEDGEESQVSESNFKYMYWNMSQQLAHHTVNGCNIKAGDMMASGTISGPDKGSYGSMLEITRRGANPVQLADGTERKFIEDGDTVIMRGHCEKDGVRVGFGEVKGKLLPAD